MKTEVFEKARALGLEIAVSDEFRRLQRAQLIYDSDMEIKEDLKRVDELNEQIDISSDDFIALKQLEELRTEVAELRARISSSTSFKELDDANTAFGALMEEVNQVIAFVINGEAQGAHGEYGAPEYGQVH